MAMPGRRRDGRLPIRGASEAPFGLPYRRRNFGVNIEFMADSHNPLRSEQDNNANARSSVVVTLEPDLVLALDRYAREHGDMTRPEALRSAFRDWAIARGYAPSADEGTRPEDLNASNDD